MHSSSAKDPYFIAKLSSEVTFAGNFIEKECAKCHTPKATIEAKIEKKEVIILSNGFLSESNEFHRFAISGISCTLCHQIKRNGISGNYSVDLNYRKPERAIYGPFIPLYGIEMYRSSGYFPTRSENFLKADFCSSCHVVYTPTIENGSVISYFPEQTTFFEWHNSVYNPEKPCQSCHMKKERFKISTKPGNLFERNAKHHHFSGANSQILSILGKNEGAKRAEEVLKSSAKIRIKSLNINENELEIVVEIENKAGHKFPTGFPSRRAIVHLVVEDEGGIVFESGKILGDGRVVGEDYPERHYELIDSEDEVQIYESVMMSRDGRVTFDLLKAYRYFKDNRILPKGFSFLSAHPDTLPVGVEDDNFSPGSDKITYLVKKSFKKPIKVKVELLYQPISFFFVESLRETKEGVEFRELIKKTDLTTLVDSDETIIQ